MKYKTQKLYVKIYSIQRGKKFNEKKMSNKVYSFIICLFISFYEVNSHGRMNDPPARNAMWRYGFAVPPNYNDLGLNCGGVGLQHQKNGNYFLHKDELK